VSVAICIPILNERRHIERTLSEIDRELHDRPYTVCLVDDGSTDGTIEIVRGWSAQHPGCVLLQRQKRGPGCQRGAASRAGLEWLVAHTDGEVFVDLDADGAQRPAELRPGADLVRSGACDVAIASKYTGGSKVVGRPLTRRIGSRLYGRMLRGLMRPEIRDYSNTFRFYNRRAAEAVLRFTPAYTTPVYMVEMLAIWLANGFRVVEVPTVYEERADGNSKVTFSDAWPGFAGAFDVARRFRRGEYRLPEAD
jgi:dolichol-phosphate mannosyltransferase